MSVSKRHNDCDSYSDSQRIAKTNKLPEEYDTEEKIAK